MIKNGLSKISNTSKKSLMVQSPFQN